MNIIDQAKNEVTAARGRFVRAIAAVTGSRAMLALSVTLALAFVCQTIFARHRLPPVGIPSALQIGLPPLEISQVARDAGAAAQRQGAPAAIGDWIGGFFAAHADLIPYANMAGAGAFSLLSLFVLWLQVRQARRASF